MDTYSAEELAEVTGTDKETIEEGDEAALRLSSTSTSGDADGE